MAIYIMIRDMAHPNKGMTFKLVDINALAIMSHITCLCVIWRVFFECLAESPMCLMSWRGYCFVLGFDLA